MAKIANDLTELIGSTPLLRMSKYCERYGINANIILKLENMNPLGSIKDRTAYAMILDAEEKNILKKGSVIVEPTSGNTGVALAYICSLKGYKLILTMPETMSVERRKLLSMLGAEIILTPGMQGMFGAIKKAKELLKKYPDSFMPNQFENMSNPKYHKEFTAKEIINDTDGNIDYFVAGVGTGGTLSGIGEALKEYNENIKIAAIEPFNSAVISGGKPGPHNLQGLGAGFIPKTLNTKIIDEILKVKNEDAIKMSQDVAKTDGLLIGISAGAAIFGAVEIAKREENKGKNIIVIVPDTGERYLTTALFDAV